jgi:hypothetical protein
VEIGYTHLVILTFYFYLSKFGQVLLGFVKLAACIWYNYHLAVAEQQAVFSFILLKDIYGSGYKKDL